jgi:hypothetical protein
VALAALTIVGLQTLFMCYSAAYPSRGGGRIAALAAPHVTADTQLFFEGHYRQTLNWYLQRGIPVYDYVGELEFGMQQAQLTGSRDRAQFLRQWQEAKNALAFVDPRDFSQLTADGMTGQIIGQDRRSIVVQK